MSSEYHFASIVDLVALARSAVPAAPPEVARSTGGRGDDGGPRQETRSLEYWLHQLPLTSPERPLTGRQPLTEEGLDPRHAGALAVVVRLVLQHVLDVYGHSRTMLLQTGPIPHR
jgi:hypothetical protein